MKPATLRALDYLLGRPLCAALTAVERVRRRLGSSPAGPPRRVLFIKLLEMGSSVLAAPAFLEAARAVGPANLFILVLEPNRPILDVLDIFPPDNILTLRDDTLPHFAADLFKALRRIRRERVDAAADLEGLTRATALIAWLSGASRRAGFHNFTSEGPYRGRLFTHELHVGFHLHTAAAFLAVTRALFREPGPLPLLKEPVETPVLPRHYPVLQTLGAVRGRVADALGDWPRGPLVLLNPNCGDLLPIRRWPAENFTALAARVLEEWPDAAVLFTGSAAEQASTDALAAAVAQPGRCASLAGRTTFRELLALYSLAQVLVTNDSGPAHFAALTPIGEVVLFGPETPLLYGPLGPRKIALTAGYACSPCVNMLNHRFSPCHDPRCMAALSVEEVIRHVRTLIAHTPKDLP